MSDPPDRDARDRIRRNHRRRQRQCQRAREFPPSQFVRTIELLDSGGEET